MIRVFRNLIGRVSGKASINLTLDTNEFLPGEKVNGYFSIKGGWFKQQLNRLECDLVVTDKQKQAEELIREGITILTSRSIDPHASSRIPFTFQLPSGLTPSSNVCQYRFRTKLTFNNGDKSVDHDQIKILTSKTKSISS